MMLVRLRMLLMTDSRIGADHRAGDAAGAALERGAADDHRGDRFQLPQQAGGGRGRAQPRHVEQRGDADAHAQQHVGQDLDAVHVDRGIARHLLVGADGLHVAAVGGAVEDDAADQRHQQEDPAPASARRAGCRNRPGCRRRDRSLSSVIAPPLAK